MTKLVCVSGMNEGDEFSLHEGKNIIGRGNSCDIALFDRKCSHSHCEIRKKGRWFSIQDLGSTNGTALNHHKLKKPKSFSAGDKIRIGGTVLVLSNKSMGDMVTQTTEDVVERLQETSFDKLIDTASADLMKRKDTKKGRRSKTFIGSIKDFFSLKK